MEAVQELGLNLPVLIAQIVNISILLIAMYLVAYKPLLKIFDERKRKIQENMAEKEHVEELKVQADVDVKKLIENARKESQGIIAQALKDGEELKQRSLKEVKQESDAMLQKEKVRIAQEREEATKELRRQFADLTIMAAEKVIERSLNKKEHMDLIENVLKEGTAQRTE